MPPRVGEKKARSVWIAPLDFGVRKLSVKNETEDLSLWGTFITLKVGYAKQWPSKHIRFSGGGLVGLGIHPVSKQDSPEGPPDNITVLDVGGWARMGLDLGPLTLFVSPQVGARTSSGPIQINSSTWTGGTASLALAGGSIGANVQIRSGFGDFKEWGFGISIDILQAYRHSKNIRR